LNHVRAPLQILPKTGYQGLILAEDSVDEPVTMLDPDGNRVTLVPPGYDGIDQIAIELSVRSLAAHHQFLTEVLALEAVSDRCYLWGETRLYLSEDPHKGYCDVMQGVGYRYLTVQVFDVDYEHQRALRLGATEGRGIVTLGETARISFIQDPDGNSIELSQRASLTGPLPE
jgi:lactoylglutathione lyase